MEGYLGPFRACVDIHADPRLYTCRATKKLPMVTVLKDYTVCLSTDREVHGSGPLHLDNSELWGYGTGSWPMGKPSEIDTKSTIPWIWTDDAGIVLWGANRDPMPMCEAVYSVFVNNNIAEITAQYHASAPLMVNQSGAEKEAFCRKSFKVNAHTTYYLPSPLDAESKAGTQVKRGYFGLVFDGHFDKLYMESSKPLFEIQLVEEGEPHLRGTKVKQQLLGQLNLEPGKYYKLQ